MQVRNSQIHSIEVYIDGKKPIIYLKTIIRTIVKGVVTQKQKSDISKKTGNSILGILANAAIDTAVGISENADLRCWRLMPGKCLVGEVVVRPGSCQIEIHYLDSANRILYKDIYQNYQVKKNHLNFIDSNCNK